MNSEKISDNQGKNMIILFIFGSTLVLGTGVQAKNDVWIAILLGALFSIPFILIYAYILSQYPGRDLFDIVEEVFGKVIGKLYIAAYTWYAFHLGALVLRNFEEFMTTVGLPETPKTVPIIIFTLLCVFAVKKGIETIAKCADYFIIIVVLLIFILVFLTLPKMKLENILPIAETDLKLILRGAFSAFSFPFCETVLFMSVFDSLKSEKSGYKVYLSALAIGSLVTVFIAVRNIMVLGTGTEESVYFPSYIAISRINIGNFLQRLEITVAVDFILSGFIKISICLLAATKGLTKLFGFKDYRFFAMPVGLLMANLAYIVYDNIMEMFDWAVDIYPYYAFPFQVIFPVIILIAAAIKTKIKKGKDTQKEEAQA